jgi:RNA polymerase sigma-70 factor, ECF subfamily
MPGLSPVPRGAHGVAQTGNHLDIQQVDGSRPTPVPALPPLDGHLTTGNGPQPREVDIFLCCAAVNPAVRRPFLPATIMEPHGARVYGMPGFASLDGAVRRTADTEPCPREEARLDAAHARELDRFLAGVERRAFRIAQLSLRDVDDAHDVVQVAMLRLAEKYSSRPGDEWRPLFYRILYNAIHDVQRRRGLQRRFFGWLPGSSGDGELSELPDPLDQVADSLPGPSERTMATEAIEQLERSLARLPPRQLEAFSLRCLEGLDVAATAAAMGCSEGSVKTHYFRALHTLRADLDEVWT